MASETADAATDKRTFDWTRLTPGLGVALFTLMLTQLAITVAMFISLRSDIALTRAELHTAIADTRAELRAEISNVRAELRADIADTRADLRAEIVAVGQRVTALGGRIRPLEDRMTRQEVLNSRIPSPADAPLPPPDPDASAGE